MMKMPPHGTTAMYTGKLSVTILSLKISGDASSNITNTEKQVTTVTSAVHPHRSHVHPTVAMSGLNQHPQGTVVMNAHIS
jgi:hypothetical protein